MNNSLKQVAVINDIVGYGKCSLSVALPTLSAAKIEVCSAATSIYTTHTPIPGFKKLETDPILEDTISAWRNLNLKFDAVYSGTLSNKNQVYNVLQLFIDQPQSIKIVDPVIGDFGKFYDKNFEALLPHMKKLICVADIITPNLTEAKFLTGIYSEDPQTLLVALKNMGAKNVVLKGIIEDNYINNFTINSKGKITKHSATYYDYMIHGAGDFFIASAIAYYLKHTNLSETIDFATKIVSNAVKFSINQNDFKIKGICFEPFLGELANL